MSAFLIGSDDSQIALADIEKHVDLNSREGQEIASVVASLGESCGEK